MKKTLFVVSDGTGETAALIARAGLKQFISDKVKILRYKNIRDEEKIEEIIKKAKEQQAIIIYTMALDELRETFHKKCVENNIEFVDLLGPLLDKLIQYLGEDFKKNNSPGALHNVDKTYFKRVEAIEYTVKHDDGNIPEELEQADIVIVGLSRTSKTPLSIFLSHKGWKVANIPLVFGTTLPEQLFKIDQRKIVGLMIDPDALYKIRMKRIEKFKTTGSANYANLQYIQQEMEYCLSIFEKNKKWPIFNVTDRALEETASDILSIICERFNLDYNRVL